MIEIPQNLHFDNFAPLASALQHKFPARPGRSPPALLSQLPPPPLRPTHPPLLPHRLLTSYFPWPLLPLQPQPLSHPRAATTPLLSPPIPLGNPVPSPADPRDQETRSLRLLDTSPGLLSDIASLRSPDA